MNSNSDRLLELFSLAVEKELPGERAHFLAEACQGDPELRQQVEALLRAHEQAGPFLKNALLPDTPDTALEGPGERIGRYKLLQKIGEGGCGVVYMAEQEEPVRRKVALKVIKLGMDTRAVIARFEAERQALAMMDHPNIAKIHDAGATETGRPYFVMELVRGVKITDYCDRNNLSTVERLKLFTQVCGAIQHAHQRGIIHRDIKPSNILVTINEPGSAAVPKVIDFGIAKATQERLTDKTLFTAFDQFIGTPDYMSPEQAAMTALDIDTRSDVYSLGVLLYELLTGRTPFDTKELMRAGLDEVRRTIREREPPRPSTRLSTMLDSELTTVAAHRQSEPAKLATLVRGDLDWIVMKAIEKDRGRRYETVNGLAMEIQRYLNEEPVLARPPSQLYRLQKLARRNRRAFVAAAVSAAVLLVGTFVSTWQAIRATRAENAQRALRAEAQSATERAEQNLYASDMRQAFQCLEKDELARTLGLLNRHRPKAGDTTDRRGFEWRYLWKLCQGDRHDFLEGVEGIVWWLEYSPGGTYLAAGMDREVAIFDMASKTIVAHVDRNTSAAANPRWAVFTPDEKTLITASHDRVKFFETTHWTELPAQFPPAGGPIALSPDGKCLLTMPFSDRFLAIKSFRTATLWDLRMLQVSRTLANVDGPLVFSPDGKRLATDTPGGIRLWSLDPSISPALLLEGSSNLLSHISGYDSLRKTVAFSPDGHRVAAGSSWGKLNIMLWDAGTGQRLDHDQLHGHRDAITGVAWSLDSKFVGSAGFDSTIQIWDITNLKPHRKLRGQLGAIWSLAFAPNGQSLVSGGGGADTIKVWPFDGTPQPEEQDLNDRWQPVWISTNGEEGITFDVAGAECWNTLTGQRLFVLPRPEAPRLPESLCAIVAGDGRTAYFGDAAGVVRFGDFATGEIIARSGGHTAGVIALSASPDGKTLVSGGRDARLCWWELPSAKLTRSYTLSGAVTRLAFSPDSKTLASVSEDLKLSWWDGATGGLLGSTFMPESSTDLVFSPDGQSLATGDRSRARIWDVATRSLRPASVSGGRRLVFSPDGTKFLVPLRLCDAHDGRSLGALEGHKTLVFDAVFSPDGRTIASGANDIRLWSADTQQELLTFTRLGTDFGNLMFSADGTTLAAGSFSPGGGGLRIWRAPSFEEIEATEKANRHNH